MSKEPTDFPELIPTVQSILSRYRQERRLSELARDLGFSKNRLSEILYGKRKLTLYYVMKFLEAEVMTVGQFFGDVKIDELPENRRILAKRLLLDPTIVDVLDEEMQALIKEAIRKKRVDDFRKSLRTLVKK